MSFTLTRNVNIIMDEKIHYTVIYVFIGPGHRCEILMALK